MAHSHSEYVEGCFTCKLKTLRFDKGWMPSQGAKVVDTTGVANMFGTDKSGQERMLDETHGVGYLRWSKGEPYKRNRKDNTWEKATDDDTETLLGRTKKESSRTFTSGT